MPKLENEKKHMTEEQRARQRAYNKKHYYKDHQKKIQYMRDYRAKKKAEIEALKAELESLRNSQNNEQ